jgi:NAD(P)-dependent dehydrogenase (short-subunit alcohol dehydrogenase family)
MFSIKNKTAVITGGARGIGRSIAHIFSRAGATVYILDLDKRDAADTIDEINREQGNAYFIYCNVADRADVTRAIDKIVEHRRTIEILVNNAGIAHIGNLENTDEEEFKKVFQVNAGSVFQCSRAVIPHMKKAGGGVILNISSVAAIVGIPDRFAYSMSKGAVHAMTLSIARDYIADHIRCNCISPARVHTPFVDNFLTANYPGREKEMFEELSRTQPIGRMGTPDEIAGLALYLCSDEAAFITGSNYTIDGGFVYIK